MTIIIVTRNLSDKQDIKQGKNESGRGNPAPTTPNELCVIPQMIWWAHILNYLVGDGFPVPIYSVPNELGAKEKSASDEADFIVMGLEL